MRYLRTGPGSHFNFTWTAMPIQHIRHAIWAQGCSAKRGDQIPYRSSQLSSLQNLVEISICEQNSHLTKQYLHKVIMYNSSSGNMKSVTYWHWCRSLTQRLFDANSFELVSFNWVATFLHKTVTKPKHTKREKSHKLLPFTLRARTPVTLAQQELFCQHCKD